MIKKRTLLEGLNKKVIYNICKQFDLTGLSSCTKDKLIDELMSKRTIKLENILQHLKTSSNKKADTISAMSGEKKENMSFFDKLFGKKNEHASIKNNGTKSKPSRNLELSFKFSDFALNLEHKHLNDIGKFAVFSLRMFRDGHTIEEISQITNIDVTVIEKQLFFLKEKGYVSEKFDLQDEAQNVLELYDLIERNNSNKPVVAFEHYLKDGKYKKVFSSNDFSNKTDKPKGFELNPLIYTYKIESIFSDMSNSAIIDYLIRVYPSFSTTIDRNKDEFIFSLESLKNSFYLNKKIPIERILDIEETQNSSINLGLPFRKYEVSIVEEDSQTQKWFQKNIEKLNVTQSLLTGQQIPYESITVIDDKINAFKLPSICESSDILSEEIPIPLEVFLNENFKRTKIEGHYLIKICEESFNGLLDN